MESLQNVLHMVRSKGLDGFCGPQRCILFCPYQWGISEIFKVSLGISSKIHSNMPNGYGPAMRAFTKLMKLPFSFLRSDGYLSVIYADDCYL